MTVWAKTRLVHNCQYFEKYHFKNSIKTASLVLVVDSFTVHNNNIIYLLAFVQLTWQVDNEWFSSAWNSLILGQCI